MIRLGQHTLLMLTGYFLLACSAQPFISESPALPLTDDAPIKIVQPEAWQCFQALNETQWHCQKDADSPLNLSLADIALEKKKDNDQIHTFPTHPREQFKPRSHIGNSPDNAQTLPPILLDHSSNQASGPSPTTSHSQTQIIKHQEIPRITSGRLHNARDEVLKLPSHFYTLQLLAVKDKQKLINFVQENSIVQPIYLNVANQEIEFHILLAGVYESFETAADQSIALEGHTKIQPWVRQLGALQNALINTPKQLQVSTVP